MCILVAGNPDGSELNRDGGPDIMDGLEQVVVGVSVPKGPILAKAVVECGFAVTAYFERAVGDMAVTAELCYHEAACV